MSQTLLHQWWLIALRGGVAILFGLLAIAWPAVTLLSLTVLFAAFALVGGAAWIFGGIQQRNVERRWWIMLVLGLVSMAAGVIAALYPAMTMLVLVLLFGANALVTGVADIAVAVALRKFIHGEWLLLLSGFASLLFGLLVLMFPLDAGILALAIVLGSYAILTGILMLALAVRVRRWARQHPLQGSAVAGPA